MVNDRGPAQKRDLLKSHKQELFALDLNDLEQTKSGESGAGKTISLGESLGVSQSQPIWRSTRELAAARFKLSLRDENNRFQLSDQTETEPSCQLVIVFIQLIVADLKMRYSTTRERDGECDHR